LFENFCDSEAIQEYNSMLRFQIKYLFENFCDSEAIQEYNSMLHRCRSRQIFWGAKDFCPNFPWLAQKKRLHLFSCWVYIFKSKHTSNTIFAQISPNLPEKN